MADRLCALLRRRGRPVDARDAVSRLLRLRNCPEALGLAVARQLVEGDARLQWHGPLHVGFAQMPAAGGLGDASFCVVDLETTGGSPGRAKITEIAAVRVRGFSCGETFSTLVDPGHPIPPVITAITSIDNAMVKGQPDISEALPLLLEFCGDDVLVAHNAPFDLRFLNYERRRLLGSYFTQPWVDTLVLARRLLDGQVPRHDLATLAEWAGTATRPCHRALADAQATAELLVRFLHTLDDRGDGSLERVTALGQWGGGRYAHKQALAEAMPAAPGVYLMRDEGGDVLYVGKATNLRRKVRTHFGSGGKGRRMARALEALEGMDHEVCGSAFEAEWRHARLLHDHQPPCNGEASAAGHYLKLTLGERYPRLFAVSEPVTGDAVCVGPLRSARVVRRALATLHRLYPLRACRWVCRPGAVAVDAAEAWCAGPCGGSGEGYGEVAAEVGRLLTADLSTATSMLAPRLAQAVSEGRIQPYGDDAEDVAALLSVFAALGRVRRARSECCVLLEASHLPGHAAAFFVAAGQVVHRDHLGLGAWRAQVEAGVAAIVTASKDGPDLLVGGAFPEVLVTTERISQRRGTPAFVEVSPDNSGESALAAVARGMSWVLRSEAAALAGDPLESAPSAA
jgi:DNA polymerase III subunit epsilon